MTSPDAQAREQSVRSLPHISNKDWLIADIIRDVAELPDRTSPDDWPEAMLVTSGELEIILAERLTIPAQPSSVATDGEVGRLREALKRIATLTPQRANAQTAADLYLTVRAIAETAIAAQVTK